MNIDQKFAVWCTTKCYHLWKPPPEILTWINGLDNIEKANAADAVDHIALKKELAASEWTAKSTARALNTTVENLRHDFVSTLNDDELKTTDPKWIEYVTAEIFAR